jgi:hypothetical protein
MKGQREKYRLGDLIAALFEEARRVTSDRIEQSALVYAALTDLLGSRVRPAHPVRLKIKFPN